MDFVSQASSRPNGSPSSSAGDPPSTAPAVHTAPTLSQPQAGYDVRRFFRTAAQSDGGQGRTLSQVWLVLPAGTQD